MKKTISLLFVLMLCLSLCACGSQPDETAAETMPSTSAETTPVLEPSWEVDYLVDDFGDSTDKAYIKCSVVGNFSNTATANADLSVLVFSVPAISNEEMKAYFAFRLLEYGDHPATYSAGDDIILKIKIGDEITSCHLEGSSPNGDLILFNSGTKLYNTIHKTLGLGETDVRCIIEIGGSKYTFTIPGETYADACNAMMREYGYEHYDLRSMLK